MITEDHSRVWQLHKRGELNEREFRTHPRRHLLQQAIGAGIQSVTPQIGALPPVLGDWYLLCTDGLIGGLWEKHLHKHFATLAKHAKPSELMEALFKQSLAEDGRDNIGVATIQIQK